MDFSVPSRFQELLRQLQEEHDKSLQRLRSELLSGPSIIELVKTPLPNAVEDNCRCSTPISVTSFEPLRTTADSKFMGPSKHDLPEKTLFFQVSKHADQDRGYETKQSENASYLPATPQSQSVQKSFSGAKSLGSEAPIDTLPPVSPSSPSSRNTISGYEISLFNLWTTVYKQYRDALEKWEEIEDPDPSEHLVGRFATSYTFGFLSFCVIAYDTIFTAYTLNYTLRTREDVLPESMQVVNLVIMLYYLVEITVKMIAYGRFFFIGKDMKWNWLDLLLILQACTDLLVEAVLNNSNLVNLTFIRLLRLMKMVRIFRLIRALKFLKDLRTMVISIASSFSALFWALITLGMVLYIFSLVFVQAMSVYLIDHGDKLNDADENRLLNHFGSVQATMLTLYQCSSGGVDWMDIYELVLHTPMLYSWAFIFFIGFFNFAVLNILTGIFMEKALAAAQPDREAQALEQRRKDDIYAEELVDLLMDMDSDQSGTISFEEFDAKLSEEYVQAYFSTFGLQIQDARMFFSLIRRCTGKDDIPIDEFLYRCVKMKGYATSMDLHGVACEVSKVHKKLCDVCTAIGIREEKSSMTETSFFVKKPLS